MLLYANCVLQQGYLLLCANISLLVAICCCMLIINCSKVISRGGGGNLGVILVRVCEPVFQNLPHSYTWPSKKQTHSYT